MKHLTIIALLMLAMTADGKVHYIKRVQDVNVECPAGTAPRLPWQVWVTYSDGKGEWRQAVWNNAIRSMEEQQADQTVNGAGSEYVVKGVIIGDNTSSTGYPIEAKVRVVGGSYPTPSSSPLVQTLPLSDVKLTGSNLLTSNRAMDVHNLLSLDISQQLYNYRDTYGLPTEGYTVSDGWDSPTTKLKGHGTGHLMSALAFAFATESDIDTKRELYRRIELIVNQLRECQERTFVYSDSLGRYLEARDYAPETELKEMRGNWAAFDEYKKDYKRYGYGYLNAIPAAHPVLIECYRPYNNEEWVWAPYYTIHKQLAGLIDIATVMREANSDGMFSEAVSGGQERHLSPLEIAEKALLTAKDMGLWVWNRMHYRTYVKREGDKAERQAVPGNRYEMWNMYIAGEVGGMCESLSRLAEMVTDGDEKAKLIEAANCFDTPALFDPVSRNIDDVRTRHANQHIPMFVGALRSYITNNNPYYYNLAYNFWEMMQGRYVYAMGGVGNGEMWRKPYSQMASMNTNVMSDGNGKRMPNPDMNETCCAYNLAKLTKDLSCYAPDDARYMDYYERVLYNQIVGSVNPHEYGVCYQYAVGLDATKPFGNRTPQESCCGGTGAENHVKYQEAAYFTTTGNDSGISPTLYVALYLPTEAVWKEKGVRIVQECEWPAEYSRIRFAAMQQDNGSLSSFALKLRCPYWATEGFEIRLNGKKVGKAVPSSYIEIPERQWKESDVVEVVMPFTKHICYGPDKMDMAFSADNGGEMKPFAAQWLGTLMYGPLVMTSPDIHTWEDASLTLSSTLNEVKKGDGLRLTVAPQNGGGKTFTFIPDYAATSESTTHYLRLNIPSGKKSKGKSDALNTDMLTMWLTTAKDNKPEDWAPHGFKRLQTRITEAENLLQRIKEKDTKATQNDIDYAASALNVAIISMRPANLAEPEDLAPLTALMEKARRSGNNSAEMRKAMNYARSVVRYVNDGSGTRDMIDKATNLLNEISNN